MGEQRWLPPRGKAILHLYAWMGRGADGQEGICAAEIGGRLVQLVSADMQQVFAMRDQAELIRDASGYSVRLVKFSVPIVLDVLSEREQT